MRLRLVCVMCLAATVVAGCMGHSANHVGPASYDIAPMRPTIAQPTAVPLYSVEVRSPSWLANVAMQYRLAYANGQERSSYTSARWAAPPAELLEHSLKRHFTVGSERRAACRLRVAVDEFIQVYEAPNKSYALIEARGTLLSRRDGTPVASHAFSLSRAAGADSRSGAAAFAATADDLAKQLSVWLKHEALNPSVKSICLPDGDRG